MSDLIPKHGGYRKLKNFEVAQLVYDVTVRSCGRYIEKFSRTRDQMAMVFGLYYSKTCSASSTMPKGALTW